MMAPILLPISSQNFFLFADFSALSRTSIKSLLPFRAMTAKSLVGSFTTETISLCVVKTNRLFTQQRNAEVYDSIPCSEIQTPNIPKQRLHYNGPKRSLRACDQ